MENIRNLIFDLGNVILNIDTKLSEIAFAKYGMNDFEKLYTLASQNELFDRLEVGSITENEFYDEFRKVTGCKLDNQILEQCWNALIMDFPAARIEMLKRLKKEGKYRTFILSNTNIIHYRFYTALLKRTYGINGLDSLVEHAYFSHEIGLKKPNRDIFDYVVAKSHIKPEESIFIDDNEANIKAANALGFNTIFLKDNNMENLKF
ncbi:MAG: HAD family phosphatase [Bacteroidales bacterium]|nr:HAD family phosphatase [Bacteroidales bacterium]